MGPAIDVEGESGCGVEWFDEGDGGSVAEVAELEGGVWDFQKGEEGAGFGGIGKRIEGAFREEGFGCEEEGEADRHFEFDGDPCEGPCAAAVVEREEVAAVRAELAGESFEDGNREAERACTRESSPCEGWEQAEPERACAVVPEFAQGRSGAEERAAQEVDGLPGEDGFGPPEDEGGPARVIPEEREGEEPEWQGDGQPALHETGPVEAGHGAAEIDGFPCRAGPEDGGGLVEFHGDGVAVRVRPARAR